MSDELEILLYGDSALRRKCEDVEVFDDSLSTLAKQMLAAMDAENGIGLAVPQVGVHKNLVIVEDRREGLGKALIMVNPEILSASRERDGYEEGCLSLPDIFEEVQRPVRISLRYQNLQGDELQLEDDALLARVIQHEMDHLDGVLFVDHLSLVRRKTISRKLKELSRRARSG